MDGAERAFEARTVARVPLERQQVVGGLLGEFTRLQGELRHQVVHHSPPILR